MDIKLIAIGNRIMGDDGLAIAVAEELSRELAEKDIQVIIGETDVEYCLDCISQGDCIIILDAAISGKPYGTVWSMPVNEAFRDYKGGIGQHNTSLLQALQLRDLKLTGLLICIEAAEVGLKLGLSEIINKDFNMICGQVKEIILDFEVKQRCMTAFYCKR